MPKVDDWTGRITSDDDDEVLEGLNLLPEEAFERLMADDEQRSALQVVPAEFGESR